MKLFPREYAAIMAEMRLSELFNEKMWARRYGLSIRTVRRLRAEARRQLLAPKGPLTDNIQDLCLTDEQSISAEKLLETEVEA